MPASPSPAGPTLGRERTSWLFLLGAMVASILAYAGLAVAVAGGFRGALAAASPVLRYGLYAFAAILLVLALSKTRGWNDPTLPSSAFRVQSILALALVEAISLYGLLLAFLTRSLSDFFVLASVALATDLFVILPRGLAYWRGRLAVAAPDSPIAPG